MGRGSNTSSDTSAAMRRGGLRLPQDPVRELIYSNLIRLGLGEHAWDVGGGPRDDLMGRKPKDRDIAISGKSLSDLHDALQGEGTVVPLEIVTDVDRQRIGYMLRAPWTPKEGFELALARQEVSTGPRHQDFEITPIDPALLDELIAQGMTSAEANREFMRRDAIRRDWTVNAVMRNVATGEMLDFVGGIADIRDRILRPISADTCRDDPMRTLRGISRISQDDLTPTPEAEQQIRENAPRLAHLTQDKIHKEITKILKGKHAGRALTFAVDTGVLQTAFPEFAASVGYDQRNPYHSLLADEHMIQAVQVAVDIDAPMEVRWGALTHDIGKAYMGWSQPGETRRRFNRNDQAGRFDPARFGHEEWSTELADQAFERQQTSIEFRSRLRLLNSEHMFSDDNGFDARAETKQRQVARTFIARVHQRSGELGIPAEGREMVDMLLQLRFCDRNAKQRGEKTVRTQDTFERVVRSELDCPMHVKELAVAGGDIIKAGVRPGPAVGEIQRELLRQIQAEDDVTAANRRSGIDLAAAVALIDDKTEFRKLPYIERWAAKAIAAQIKLDAQTPAPPKGKKQGKRNPPQGA